MSNPHPTHYRVKATGTVMEAVGRHGSRPAPEYLSTARELNMWVVRLLDQETGEIRTFRLNAVEPAEG
ncbi:hypothetical protein [Kocuria rhizophila]|uniref:hypothetical protein n=1 Tax=Kocuria rhizophila TaxID=72000 RepID=UPI002ED48D06|nr:hypothetical protein OH817_01270 [Kocuria rhizophila]